MGCIAICKPTGGVEMGLLYDLTPLQRAVRKCMQIGTVFRF